MEDVLAAYERPLDEKQPVICVDEKPVQLLADVREPIPARQPGQIAKYDNEYERRGMANIFCAIEPKAGRHFTEVTPNRSGAEFAKMIKNVADAYERQSSVGSFYGALHAGTRQLAQPGRNRDQRNGGTVFGKSASGKY